MYDITHIPRTKRSTKLVFAIYGLLCCLLFNCCSPVYRFEHLLQNHPYLANLYAKDSVVVQTHEDLDTLFYFSSQKDTIVFNDTKLYRTADTIRLVRTFKPCTTYLSKTIQIPQKTIERERWKVQETRYTSWIIGLLCLILLIVLLRK